jgi:hypothetical protein
MSPMMFRWLVWADVGRGQWEIQGSSRTPKGAEKIERRIQRQYKGKVTTRIEDRENPVLQPDRLKRTERKKKDKKTGRKVKGPPRLGGKWKNRKRPLGARAREILRKVRGKKKKLEIQTALELARDRQMDQLTFVNLIQSMGFTGQEAYTFWFSPP